MRQEWDLSEIVDKLLEFRREREWEQFHHPKEVATALGIEVSELQEHFLWRENESPTEIQADSERYQGMKEEIADIAIYLAYLCHDLDIDLSQAIKEKMRINNEKYPKDKYRGIFKTSS